MTRLARFLLAGYGVGALSAAFCTARLDFGALAALLVFWVGGAGATLLLAAAFAPFLPARVAARPGNAAARENANLAEALRRWEKDRLGDSADDVAAPVGARPARASRV